MGDHAGILGAVVFPFWEHRLQPPTRDPLLCELNSHTANHCDGNSDGNDSESDMNIGIPLKTRKRERWISVGTARVTPLRNYYGRTVGALPEYHRERNSSTSWIHYSTTSTPRSFRSKICRNDVSERIRPCEFVWRVSVRTLSTPKRSHNAAKSITGQRGPFPLP